MKKLSLLLILLFSATLILSAKGEPEKAGSSNVVIAVPRSQGSEPHTFMALVTEEGEKLRVHEDNQKEIMALEPYLYEFVVQHVSGGGPFDSVKIISFKRAK